LSEVCSDQVTSARIFSHGSDSTDSDFIQEHIDSFFPPADSEEVIEEDHGCESRSDYRIDYVVDLVDDAVDMLVAGFAYVRDLVQTVGQMIVEWGMRVIDAISEAFSTVRDAVNEVKEMVSALWTWVEKTIISTINPIIENIKSFAEDYYQNLLRSVRNIIKEYSENDEITDEMIQQFVRAFFGDVFQLFTGFVSSIIALGYVLGTVTFGAGTVISFAIPIIIGLLVPEGGGVMEVDIPLLGSIDEMTEKSIGMVIRDLELNTTLDWVMLIGPSILSVIMGAFGIGSSLALIMGTAIALTGALSMILVDAATEYEDNQTITNAYVGLFGSISVAGALLSFTGLIKSAIGRSVGGAIIGVIGTALGVYGGAQAHSYIKNNPT